MSPCSAEQELLPFVMQAKKHKMTKKKVERKNPRYPFA